MNRELALCLIDDHYIAAKGLHPDPKTAIEWIEHLNARAADIFSAAASDQIPDNLLIAGKRALQLAAMCVRVIEDLGLGLVGPGYDACNLKHGKS